MKKSLCCISLQLQEKGIKANTMTKTRFLALERKSAVDTVSKRTLNNVSTTVQIISLCAKKGWNYRISSDLFPLATLPEANLSFDILPDKNKIYEMFKLGSEIITKNKVRCSTHPDQFVVPAYKGDTKDIAKRFIDVYNDFPVNVKSRLVLENEDKPNSWGLINLYDLIYQKTGIPITYDSHHFRLNNPENISPEKAILMCMETWGKYKPLFHYSNGKTGPTDRAHSDYVYTLHKELFENDVDVDFEFKAKDYAIEKFQTEFKV